MRGIVLFLGWAGVLCGCAAEQPPHWADGGARLKIPSATWARPRGDVVIAPSGVVDVAGDRALTIDPSGRVRGADGEPLAVLETDGRLVGAGGTLLATVTDSTAKPASSLGGVAVMPDGRVMVSSADGERGAGSWVGGCNTSPAALRACTLVVYLAMRYDDERAAALEERDLRRGRRDR